MDELMQEILDDLQIFIGGDFNENVDKCNDVYDRVHRVMSLESRMRREKTLWFCYLYDLVLTNTCSINRESHLITFKSGRT